MSINALTLLNLTHLQEFCHRGFKGDLQHFHPLESKRAEQEPPTPAFAALDLLPLLGARSPGAELHLIFGFSSSHVGSGLRLEEDHVPPLRSGHFIDRLCHLELKKNMHCALLGLSKVIFGVAVHYPFCPIREIPRAIILCSVVALRTANSPLFMACLSQSSFSALPEGESTKISSFSLARRAAIRLGLR